MNKRRDRAMAQKRIELRTVFNAVGGFTRKEVIERLKEFREEWGEMFVIADAPVALVLSDVCDVLGLDEEEEVPQVLGPEVAKVIRDWEHSRLWEISETRPTPFWIMIRKEIQENQGGEM